MLTQVRGALKGVVAWIVIILLVAAFALFGVPEVSQFRGNAAVTVGNEKFSAQYVQNEFNRALRIQQTQSGGGYTREDAMGQGLVDDVISSIATTSALDQFSDKMLLLTPRPLVQAYLRENENFQNPATGEFDQMALRSILQNVGISAAEFESRVASDLKRQQLIESLALSANAPKPLTRFSLMSETERRLISYLVVTEDLAGDAAEPSEEDLKAYYEANPAEFTAPEYRVIDLLVLRNSDFTEGASVSEEDLKRIYEQNRARLYEKPERRTLYQITFDSAADAQAAAARLQQGVSFEEIATERGRSLESVTFADAQKRDILDPSVADAAFAPELSEGAVVGPLQGLFGWTVAQIAGVTPPEITSFEDAREKIEADFLSDDTRRALLDAIDEIEEARDTGASLTYAAEAAGFEVSRIGPIDRVSFAPGGAIIDKVPGEALQEAFSLEIEQRSEAMQLAAKDGYFFVSVSEIRPPALIAFDEVREDVLNAWSKQEREQRLAATVDTLKGQIADGASLADVAAPLERTPIRITVDRQFANEAISQNLIEEIFSVAPGGTVSAPASLGEALIIASVDQTFISDRAAPAQQQEFFAQYLGFQLDQELLGAFLEGVREDYQTKVNQAQIDAVFGQ